MPIVDPAAVTRDNWRDPPFNRWAFHHVDDVLSVAPIARGDLPVVALDKGAAAMDGFALALPGGGSLELSPWLDATATDALVVLHQGRLAFEFYADDMAPATPHLLMSASKALIGLLASLLAAAGRIDLASPVTGLVPEVTGGGYDGVTLRQLLDMRAGVLLDASQRERYDAAVSGIAGADGVTPTLHGLLAEHWPAASVHGGPFSYVSLNTDLAGWAIERATGRTIPCLLGDMLWQRVGAEHDAQIVVDTDGSPWCSGGVCATARDLARLGLAMLNGGAAIPAVSVDDLASGGDAEAWATGEWGRSFGFLGPDVRYRAGWYAVGGPAPLLFAMGVHGQNLFIDRRNDVVIAKLSSQAQRIDARAIGLTHMAVPELTRLAIGA